jgi:hypothetical protein
MKVMGRRRTVLAALSGMLMAVCMFVAVSRVDQYQELEVLGESGVSMVSSRGSCSAKQHHSEFS